MIDNEDKEILLDHDKLKAERKKLEEEFSVHAKYIDDWQVVLGTPAGRRIVWDLIGGLGFQNDLFNSDPLIMAGNCRGHKIAVAIVKDIEEAMPGVYARMTNEFRSSNKER